MLKNISGSNVAFKSISFSLISSISLRKTYWKVRFLLGLGLGMYKDNVSGGRLELYLASSTNTCMFITWEVAPEYLIIAPTIRPEKLFLHIIQEDC